ncbi:MAG TPA: hypothetical protein VMG98_04265 [Verrucomicrobiae bacterium]|nr:hypothetical protein [Verrucomicrobiae bacterium]
MRTNYFTWPPGSGGSYDPNADPDNPNADPSEATPVAGLPSNGTMATDEEQYFRPLERVHGMGLHAPGVALGMDLLCTIGSTNVQVLPGIALDPSGKHIFLASGGSAAIGPGSDYPGPPPVTASVSDSGVILPTTGLTGDQYVVAQWWETWDSASYYSTGVNQFDDTPWLQFVDASEYDPDIHVALGKVNLNSSGEISAVSYGDVGGIQRTSVSMPAQSLQLQRATLSGSTVSSTAWGEVRAREGGGIEIITQSMSDAVNVVAGHTAFGDESNPSIVLDANDAILTVGAPNYYGELQMHDENGNQTLNLQGKNGAASVQQLNAFQNGLIDCYTTLFHCHGTDLCLDGRSHNNNRALVDWGNQLIINFDNDYGDGVQITGNLIADNNLTVEGFTTLNGSAQVAGNLQVYGTLEDGNGVPLEGNPARKVQTSVLLAGASDFGNWGNSNSTDIVLPQSSALTAMAYFNFEQYYVSISYNAAGCAEITAIDGNSTGAIITGNGILGNIAPSLVNSNGQTVTFQTRAGDDSLAVAASCVVFFE